MKTEQILYKVQTNNIESPPVIQTLRFNFYDDFDQGLIVRNILTF